MMYQVKYTEVYQKVYEVEANSPEEAEEKLLENIGNGSENSPEECIKVSTQVYDDNENDLK